MTASNYDPVYQHVDWIDNVDRVQAGGEHGFNQELSNIAAEFASISKALNAALTLPGLTVDGVTVIKDMSVGGTAQTAELQVTGPTVNAPQGNAQFLTLNIQNFVVIGGATRVGGDLTVTGAVTAKSYATTTGPKNFRIPHPLDPQGQRLVHSCLEGPENGVYYRGEGRLQDGCATVELPDYFEALCRPENRTVHLTPKVSGVGRFGVLAASEVLHGRFDVRGGRDASADQEFYWEVRAVRGDLEPLDVVEDARTGRDTPVGQPNGRRATDGMPASARLT